MQRLPTVMAPRTDSLGHIAFVRTIMASRDERLIPGALPTLLVEQVLRPA
jgi:hypothetical protein